MSYMLSLPAASSCASSAITFVKRKEGGAFEGCMSVITQRANPSSSRQHGDHSGWDAGLMTLTPFKTTLLELGRQFSCYSACYASMRIWVQILNVHIKSGLGVTTVSALAVRKQKQPGSFWVARLAILLRSIQWETLPQKTLWGVTKEGVRIDF